MCDAEILDELTTSRGEFKIRTISFNEDRRGQVNSLAFSHPFHVVLRKYSSDESHIPLPLWFPQLCFFFFFCDNFVSFADLSRGCC